MGGVGIMIVMILIGVVVGDTDAAIRSQQRRERCEVNDAMTQCLAVCGQTCIACILNCFTNDLANFIPCVLPCFSNITNCMGNCSTNSFTPDPPVLNPFSHPPIPPTYHLINP